MQNNIGEARRSYGLTCVDGKFSQEDAAAYFGVSLSTYQKWEQGTGKSLKVETLCAMADLYGTSVDYLLRRTSDPAFEPVRCAGRHEREVLGLFDRLDENQQARIVDEMRDYAIANDAKKESISRDGGMVTGLVTE